LTLYVQDLVPDADATARNYFSAAMTALDGLKDGVSKAINEALDSGTMFKAVFAVAAGIFVVQILQGLLQGIKKNNALYLAWASAVNVVTDRGPKLLLYIILALAFLRISDYGITDVTQKKATKAANAIDIQTDTNTELAEGLRDYLAVNGKSNPVFMLRQALLDMSKSINALDYALISQKITRQVQEAADNTSVGAGDVTAAAGAGLFLGWHMSAAFFALDAIVDLFIHFSFIMMQYSMAKAMLLNYVYLSFAWFMALRFLPIAIMLAYFQSLRSFMVNIAQHMVAMMLAASLIAVIGQKVYSQAFWTGGGAEKGILTDIFAGAAMNADKTNWIVGSFPYVMNHYASAIANLQLIFLFGIIAMFLSKMYEIARGAMSGSMATTYQGKSSSTSALIGGQ